MGMAASQARLLSITARLTDNEQSGQAISYAKERLANQTDQLNAEYNNALAATKFTVLTSFDGASPNYDDLTYNVLTSAKVADLGKQYVVTDTRGRVLVSETIADNFKKSKGDLNKFLKLCAGATGIYNGGYSLSDIDPALNVNDNNKTTAHEDAEKKIHQAWDEYLKSVGVEYGDAEHDFGFGWMTFTSGTDAGYGYATYTPQGGQPQPINFEGTTKEQRELYDYAVALTESYCSTSTNKATNTAYNVENKSMLTYYHNLFEKLQSNDYITYTSQAAKAAADSEHYIMTTGIANSKKAGAGSDINVSPLNDATTFVNMLKDGRLRIEYYSTTEKKFVATTLSEDESIQEVKDESKISAAETKYTQALQDLEKKDSRFDMQLKKLDTEHNTLQTEYDSVKNVIDKNVEKTFSIFS